MVPSSEEVEGDRTVRGLARQWANDARRTIGDRGRLQRLFLVRERVAQPSLILDRIDVEQARHGRRPHAAPSEHPKARAECHRGRRRFPLGRFLGLGGLLRFPLGRRRRGHVVLIVRVGLVNRLGLGRRRRRPAHRRYGGRVRCAEAFDCLGRGPCAPQWHEELRRAPGAATHHLRARDRIDRTRRAAVLGEHIQCGVATHEGVLRIELVRRQQARAPTARRRLGGQVRVLVHVLRLELAGVHARPAARGAGHRERRRQDQ